VSAHAVAVGLALAAWAGRGVATSDEQLLHALREAARARATPAQVEARVGRRAIINTSRGEDERHILEHATIYPDDAARTSPLTFAGARDVVYWGRDVPAHNAPIVGLVWKRDGAVEVFTAFVLPP
jgi:hypothetical protein